MKSTTSTLFPFFLLLAFISYLPSTILPDFVLDTDGMMLINGGVYYMLPGIRGNGGGIGRAATGNETWPQTVVQERSELDKGLPIIIASQDRNPFTKEGLDLSLSFQEGPTQFLDPTPLKWTIVEDLQEGPSVKLPGYENTVDGWFKIEKSSMEYNNNKPVYKLVFRATSTDSCSDIWIHPDGNGTRRLVLTKHDRLRVQFKKALPLPHEEA